jgi:hypothetical protein
MSWGGISRFVTLLALTAILTACHTEVRREPGPPQTGWRQVGSWSGRGNTQTDSFHIESGQFRVKWETQSEISPEAGRLRVMANSAVSGRPIALAVESTGTGHGIGYVSDDPRLFYLLIESNDVDWSITVEEGVTAVAPGSP